MEENKKSRGFGVSALIASPLAIGLGIGTKGFLGGGLSANRPNPSPFTGGIPDRLEMIGRSTGESTNQIIAKALNQSKKNVAALDSFINSKRFEEMAFKPGPQRNAVIAAYKSILNSPYLGLTEDEIAQETGDILTASSTMKEQEFVDMMKERINKKALEFGPERKEEFLKDFVSEIKSQLKFEKFAVQSPMNLPSDTINSNFKINTKQISLSEINSDYSESGMRAKKNLSALQEVINNNLSGNTHRNLSVYEVFDQGIGTKAYMARVQVGSASFDIPLLAGRTILSSDDKILPLNTTGGFIFRGYKNRDGVVNYSSRFGGASYLTSFEGAPQAIENYFIQALGKSLRTLNSASPFQHRAIEEDFYNATFNRNQLVAPVFSRAQRSNLVLSVFRVINSIDKFVPGSRMHEIKLASNKYVKTDDVGYSQLSTGERFLVNAPTIETSSPYYKPGDLDLKSRSSSLRKTNTILESVRAINPIWSNRSNIFFSSGDNLTRELNTLNKEARTNRLVFYQFEEDSYLSRYNLDLGAYLGRTMRYRTNPSSIKDIDLTGNTKLLDYIMKNYDPETNQVFLTRKQLMENQGVLGRHVGGAVATLPTDQDLDGLLVTLRNSKHKDAISLSYQVSRKSGRFSKVRSLSLKGQVVRTNKNRLMREARRAFGMLANDFDSYGFDPENIIVSDTDQIFREKLALKNQMVSAYADMLSRKSKDPMGAQYQVENFINNVGKNNLEPDDIAKTIIREMKKNNFSNAEISAVVAGQVRLSVKGGKQYTDFLDDPNDVLANVLKNAKGFYGIDTLSLDTSTTLQGGGRLASVERRTLHALVQNLKSSGVSDSDTNKVLADVLSRTGFRKNWQNLLTNQTFLTSAMSFEGKVSLKDLESLSLRYDLPFTRGSTSFSLLSDNIRRGKYSDPGDYMSILKKNTIFELKFDTQASIEAARNVFGRESILLPGFKGSPALNRILSKTNGQKVNLGSEYEQIIMRIMKMSKKDIKGNAADRNQLEEEFKKLRSIVSKISAESALSISIGKVSGSVAARAWTLNSLESNKDSYNKMYSIASKDKGLTVFANDSAFLNMMQSQRKHLNTIGADDKQHLEMVNKIRSFYFGAGDDIEKGGGIFGFFGRHPTLGEGHAGAGVVRRYIDKEETSALLKNNRIKRFLKKNFKKDDHETFTSFLSGRIGNTQQQYQFANILYRNKIQTSGDATFRVPVFSVNVAVNGNKNPVLTKFSRLTNMIGDVDGDLISFIMHTSSVAPMKQSMLNDAPINFFRSNVEFLALKNHIKKHQDSKVFNKVMSTSELLVEDVMKMVHSKRVEKFSVALDALKVSTLAKGENEVNNRVAMQALVLIEEMMLKSKKQKVALDIADQVATAVFKEDKDSFKALMKAHIFGDNPLISLEYDISNYVSDAPAMKYDLNYDEVLDYIWNNYKSLKSEGGLDLRNIKTIVNKLNFAEDLTPEVFQNVSIMLKDLYEGKGGLIQAANAEAAGIIKTESAVNVAKGAANSLLGNMRGFAKSKAFTHGLAPIAAGLAGTIALSNYFSSNERLNNNTELYIPPQNENVQVPNDLPIDEESRDYQFINRNNVVSNETYLEDGNQSIVQSTLEDASSIKYVQNIVNSFGTRNNHVYIQDNRKPLTKNYIDSFRED